MTANAQVKGGRVIKLHSTELRAHGLDHSPSMQLHVLSARGVCALESSCLLIKLYVRCGWWMVLDAERNGRKWG